MENQLAKTYEPSEVEDRLYKFWLDGGYFHAEVRKINIKLIQKNQNNQY